MPRKSRKAKVCRCGKVQIGPRKGQCRKPRRRCRR